MRVSIAVLAAGAALIGVATAVLPATAALAAGEPDIAITGSFDKASYTVGQAFTLTVKVTNKSTVDATHVHVTGGDSEGVENTNFGVIQTGFDLAAGASRTVEVTGTIADTAQKSGRAFIGVQLDADNGEANEDDNILIARTKVPGAFGTIAGLVFPGDDASSTPTEGEPGLPGVKVVILDETSDQTYGEATTRADGRFVIDHVPAGIFRMRFTPPSGWKILISDDRETEPVQVLGGETSEVQIVAKRVTSTASPSASASSSPAPGGNLPVTGPNTALLVMAGIATVATGAVLLIVARRRRIRLEA
jgi:uncharacterized repeat protein (TIGR01451 family)